MTEEGNGSNGFIIIAIIMGIIVVASISIANISAVVTKVLNWILGIVIVIVVLLITAIILRYIKRNMRFTTDLTLGIRIELVDPNQIDQLPEIGIIEVVSLPQWADISEKDSQGEINELNEKQLQATESFIRGCMNIQLPFGLLLTWTQTRCKITFWTAATSKNSTDHHLLKERIVQLEDYLKTNFPEIKTKSFLTKSNPIVDLLIKEKETHKVALTGTAIHGKHFLLIADPEPFLNSINAFFKQSTTKPNGMICFTSYPDKQSRFTRTINKWITNKRYKNISQNVQLGITENQLFSSSRKQSRTRQSITHQHKLQRAAIEYEKSKATIINLTSILLCCSASAESEELAQKKAESLLQRTKGTLDKIVNPNDENSYQFKDVSREELERHLSKMFFVDSYLLPYSSKCLSTELAFLMRMPNKNTGLRITREERSVLPILSQNQPTEDCFPIGKIQRENESAELGQEVFWSYSNLLKHTFVSGATGGGKTYTICKLIEQAQKENIPSIVIDLGKGELFTFLQNIIPDLRVFTLGDDSVCPIRLNPLECPEWTTPQQHFDNIKWILDASLPQFEPLPIVTYRALNKLFTTDGWDLGEGTKGKTRTLEDLLQAGLEVCDEVGYAEEVYQNMRGAWNMRIGSLMEGSIGRQLFTDKSLPIEELCSSSTVLEIRTIQSTAQKMITLLLLTQIFDYYKSLGPTNSSKPRCLIVLDEAETIFASAEVFGNDVEMVTAAYNAVQKLNQILRQGRAFGLAVVIATQSPTNISHEVIANTENKIIHRLHHGRDKRVIQEALELTNTQTAKVSSLKPGECYAVDGLNEFPYFMRILKPPISGLTHSEKVKNQHMKEQMEGFYQQYTWMKNVYQGSPEKAFDRMFDKAVSEVSERMKLNEYTRKRIEMLLERGVFQQKIKQLVGEFVEEVIDERTFYQELLDNLHDASEKVIGENKQDLRIAALELMRAAMQECSFVDKEKIQDILKTTRELVFIDGGS
ncbi:MAG: ATP-binding protein [Candidatus Heimdallarchaeota archaeon]|nr:ATP-binding protein [Candidatus Heimdallarchaeota archaeon]